MAALPTTYKAFVYEKFGPAEDVLRLRDVPMEPLPPTSVRVRVHSAAINPADLKLAEGALQMMSGTPSAEKPLRLGFDVAGVVVEVGSQATGNFKVGDAVYAMTPTSATGTLAEYVSLESDSLALKPETLDFSKAASAPAVALTSYQALISDYGKLQPGERLLILGGSTSVGMYAIQHAKMLGAHVIATASSQKVALLKSLGADEVIDYTTTKWSEKLAPHSLDVILDCGVETESWDGDAQLILKKQGSRFVTVLPGAPPSTPKFGATHVSVFCYHSGAQLATFAKLIDAGKLKPILDSVFPFDQTLEALAKVQTGHVLGKVVVEIQ